MSRRPPLLPRPARPAMAAWVAAALLAGGCASPSAPPSWHSVVAPAAAAPRVSPLASPMPSPITASMPTVAIGRIAVPEAVDRPALVLESADGPRLLDGQRWIEPLKAQLPRALALLVTERLPGTAVVAWPTAPAAPEWRLNADVQRFELAAGVQPSARLRVVWSLRAGEGPAVAQVFEAAVPAAGGDPAALVAAMRQALATWADQVTARLKATPAA